MAGERIDPARREDWYSAASRRIEDWSRGYAVLPGASDELIQPDGTMRPVWRQFLGRLAELPADELDRRFLAADRHIRDMGISYRVHGETREREWPLSRLPLLIGADDWAEISAGVLQRVRLSEALLADIYGEGRMVSEGILPAAVIAGSPEFLPRLGKAQPPGGQWLRFFAVDIGRGPDGRWWILNNRTQAPSGAGYALENRLAVAGSVQQILRDMNVERLAGFFRDFRAGLSAAAERASPRICLMTAGPYSQTYAEQAYLARYLGFLLVEGSDLAVRDGCVYVRTIAGLKRADVILRRIDSDWCDPLEMNAASQIGVPGLMSALRSNGVVVANMPGSGVLESRALMSFMPSLCHRLLGEDLRLSNIATWWCGQPAERRNVRDRLDDLVIAGAFTNKVQGLPDGSAVLGSTLSPAQRDDLARRMEARGVDFVGQEVVRLSTTPVLEHGKLEPRPFVLRVYAAMGPDGWRVMPGGFCRISDQRDARAVSMGDGVQSADAWVVSDRPVDQTTLLPTAMSVKIIRRLGNLPSRAADNLFWFGRYCERLEAVCRIIRSLGARSTGPISESDADMDASGKLLRILVSWGAVPKDSVEHPLPDLLTHALCATGSYGTVRSVALLARQAASVIRERLSQEAWQTVSDLENLTAGNPEVTLSETDIQSRCSVLLRALAALSGLMNENFNRSAGWSFMSLGRHIERGVNTCRMTRNLGDPDATAESLDTLLELVDSQITYRSRYIVGVALAPVRDMALLDANNPRSVAFQAEQIDHHLSGLPTLRQDGLLEAPQRLSARLSADLSIAEAETLDLAAILGFENRFAALAEAISARYFLEGAGTGRAEKPTGLA